MSGFVFPYDDSTVRETMPKKFGDAYVTEMTIGNSNTEWISSDTIMRAQR